ncbi:hypothetical protein Taro_001312, partial [Colocasia esculenta]|nr:hypothetical protein [Colocasia esculenta]
QRQQRRGRAARGAGGDSSRRAGSGSGQGGSWRRVNSSSGGSKTAAAGAATARARLGGSGEAGRRRRLRWGLGPAAVHPGKGGSGVLSSPAPSSPSCRGKHQAEAEAWGGADHNSSGCCHSSSISSSGLLWLPFYYAPSPTHWCCFSFLPTVLVVYALALQTSSSIPCLQFTLTSYPLSFIDCTLVLLSSLSWYTSFPI